MTSANLQRFSERMLAHQAEGLGGAELFLAMAADPQLPPFMPPRDTAELLGVSNEALRKQRYRRRGPDFIKHNRNELSYHTSSICRHIASRFVYGTQDGA